MLGFKNSDYEIKNEESFKIKNKLVGSYKRLKDILYNTYKLNKYMHQDGKEYLILNLKEEEEKMMILYKENIIKMMDILKYFIEKNEFSLNTDLLNGFSQPTYLNILYIPEQVLMNKKLWKCLICVVNN